MATLMDGLARLLSRSQTVLSRLASPRTSHNLHHARFSYPHELERLRSPTWHTETGVLLGVSTFKQPVIVRPTPDRRELGNLLVTAPTRGGKGLLAISQLLTWPHSVIVNDIKGELYRQTAGYRKTLGKVYVINVQGYGQQYDPLAGKETEDALYAIAAHMLFTPDEGQNAVFTQRETVMLTQMLLAARAEKVAPFAFVRQCDHDGLRATAAKLATLAPDLAKRFLSVEFEQANFDNRFLICAWEGLSAKIYPFLTEKVVRSISGSDFRASELMTSKSPITVYVQIPELELTAKAPLVRLLFGSFLDELSATYDRRGGKGCQPVLLLVDEAGRTAIPSLAEHAATVNGRGISLWLSIQSLSQLDHNYGVSRARTLRDNMDSQLYYRPNNLETAQYLEARLGRRSAFAYSQTSRERGGESAGLSEQAIPLLTAFDIHRLGDEDIIGFHRHLPAFQLKRMSWLNFRVLQEREAIPPPPMPVLPPLRHLPVSIWEQIRHDTDKPPYVDPDDPYKKN
jgi:type IV secretory pathway TraG/TraD family ATPase VirD4